MAVLRQIAQLGHPVLRENAAEVADFADPSLQGLAEDLLATLQASGGVGIAAPQVYVSSRVLVVASRPNARYPRAPEMEPAVMVNPQLLWSSDDQESGWEGCLSIPGIRGLVPRSIRVGIVYQTLDGTRTELELEGFPARIFQHEIDHLNGLFFLDRIVSNRDLVTEQEYFRKFPS